LYLSFRSYYLFATFVVLGIGLKVTTIAKIFDMETRALRYQLKKNLISAKRSQELSDERLDERVTRILERYPNAGN